MPRRNKTISVSLQNDVIEAVKKIAETMNLTTSAVINALLLYAMQVMNAVDQAKKQQEKEEKKDEC